jgi:tetratricopeptide (TPR) repeat protein
MNNLALGYQEAGKLGLALPLYEQTLKLRQAKLGPDHPDTLTSMNNLAVAYRAVGKLNLAMPLLEETLKLRQARLGPDHPDTLTTMADLATGYKVAGNPELAVPLLEEVLKHRKSKLGDDHPDTLTSMNNLAVAYRAVGKLKLALPLLEETLKVRRARLGPDHPDTLTSMNNLASGYGAMGKLDLALPLYQEAAAAVEKGQFRHEHADFIINGLCLYLEWVKQFDQAEPWRRKWLVVVKERSGADSMAYGSALANLGRNLLQQHKLTDAEALLRDCLALWQKKQPDAWQTFHTQSLLGGALLGRKRDAEAEPLLLQGYQGMKVRQAKMASMGRIYLTEALERLVQLYDALEKTDEAAKWRKELDAHKKPPGVKKQQPEKKL